LMPFAPDALAPSFQAEGFQSFRRVFLQLALPPAAPADRDESETAVTHFGGMRLEPWGSATYEEAARLILHAYQRHVDSLINDQYRSFAGAVRFMHNIAHYPGCGAFDPAASFIARSTAHGQLEGMILASRVKPEVAHITQICVLPERQRQGLGQALIARTLAQLRHRGVGAATLTVTAGNTGAVNLYRQLGFTARSEFDAYVWERPADDPSRGRL
ncbi:MAG: GNAT family N-acetyltransferase, partial [Streptosporangiaceae bacterium]